MGDVCEKFIFGLICQLDGLECRLQFAGALGNKVFELHFAVFARCDVLTNDNKVSQTGLGVSDR